jgi:hypothetical protein
MQTFNKFLYELCLDRLKDAPIVREEYNEAAFGSWRVEMKDERIVYDGKDALLIRQKNDNGEWTDVQMIRKDEMSYGSFLALIKGEE